MNDTPVDDQVDDLLHDLEVAELRIGVLERQLAEQRGFAIAELRKARRWLRAREPWQHLYRLLGEVEQGLDHWLDGADPNGGTNGETKTDKGGNGGGTRPWQGLAQAHDDEKGTDAGGDTVDS